MNIRTLPLSIAAAAALLLSLSSGGCSTSPQQPAPDATDLARQYPVIDTHIDVPYRLFKSDGQVDVSAAAPDGQFDYPRAVAGGLNGAFMSIYIPAAVDAAGEAYEFAEAEIDAVRALTTTHPDKFAIATCSGDIEAQMDKGVISLPMGMENGGPVAGEVANLEHFYQRGIRYITLTHSKSNHISDSSYDEHRQWQGLSPFGKQLIAEMNRIGMIIDVSHISDDAFWQVMELSQVPVLATHSSMRHFTPGFERNMSDDMVQAMAERGGVIQINYGSSFLHQPAQDYGKARTAAVKAYQQANHLADDDPALRTFAIQYMQEHPYPFADLDVVLDHIDRAVAVAGIDAVGIGSDYDGVGDSLPLGLKDVSSYPNLVQGLIDRGYSEADIAKILGGNTLRVWRAVEAHARDQGRTVPCAGA